MSEQSEFEQVPAESEQLDQLSADDTLIDRGQPDPLDEGYVAPDGWSSAQGFGNTAAEAEQGATLDQRLKEENPDVGPGSFGGDGTPDQERAANDPGTTNVLADDAEALPDGALTESEATSGQLAPEVGDARAGRLVDAETADGADVESELIGEDVGLSGGAASAEEAAVHIIESE